MSQSHIHARRQAERRDRAARYGVILRSALKDAGLTPHSFYGYSGIHSSQTSDYMNGRCYPNRKNRQRIYAVLRVRELA